MKTIKWNELQKSLGSQCDIDCINKNQIILKFVCGQALFSYKTLCAVKQGNTLYITNYHDYSATTNKYVKQFSGLTAKARRNGLINETIILIIF